MKEKEEIRDVVGKSEDCRDMEKIEKVECSY